MKLSERIEAAEAGSRELDAEIAIAVGVKHGPDSGWSNSENGDYWVTDECAPHYTTSLDAANSLTSGYRNVRPYHIVSSVLIRIEQGELPDNLDDFPRFVCAAALKARGL